MDFDNEFFVILYWYVCFEKFNGGIFWFLFILNEAGSKGWDVVLLRVVIWVKLRDK